MLLIWYLSIASAATAALLVLAADVASDLPGVGTPQSPIVTLPVYFEYYHV